MISFCPISLYLIFKHLKITRFYDKYTSKLGRLKFTKRYIKCLKNKKNRSKMKEISIRNSRTHKLNGTFSFEILFKFQAMYVIALKHYTKYRILSYKAWLKEYDNTKKFCRTANSLLIIRKKLKEGQSSRSQKGRRRNK